MTPTDLMEREYGGLRVELHYDAERGTFIRVQLGEETPQQRLVPPEKALDAFHHPYAYLHRAA